MSAEKRHKTAVTLYLVPRPCIYNSGRGSQAEGEVGVMLNIIKIPHVSF